MVVARRGTVFLSEDTDYEPFEGEVYLGTFSGYHDSGYSVLRTIERAPLAEALRWARDRAPQVLLRLADSDYFSAGEVEVAGSPAWRDEWAVERRRPAGQEWRDRSPGDEPIAWAVEVEIAPPAVDPRPDWKPAVGKLAAAADAVAWDRGSLHVDPAAALLREGRPVAGADPQTFLLELVVDAPTVDVALRDAVARCAVPAGWSVVALGLPLAHRPPRPKADTWIVEGEYGFPSREARAIAAAIEDSLARVEAIVAWAVTARGDEVSVSAKVAAPSEGRAVGVVADAIDFGPLAEDIGWTWSGWGARPA